VTYDGCIKKDKRSENFHTMNERVARELIRAFQHGQGTSSFVNDIVRHHCGVRDGSARHHCLLNNDIA